MVAEAKRLAEEKRLEQEKKEAEEKMLEELERKAEIDRLEIAKRVAESEKRVAEQERLYELEKIAEKERLLEKARIEEIERLKEIERIEEENRKQELKRIENAKRIAEEQRIAEENKRIEAEKLEELKRIEEAKRIAFEEAIALESSFIANTVPSAFFGGRKNVQIQQIQKFLYESLPDDQKDTKILDVSKFKGTHQDQLSKEVTEILPGLNLASFLTLSEDCISKQQCVIEVSNEMHGIPAADAVMHINIATAATEHNFEKLADKVAKTKSEGGQVLISCDESTGLAATLCIAYAVKYEGMSVKNAKKYICKRRPQAELDTTTLRKLTAWEWKLRREKLFQQTLQLVATWLPMLSILGLICLALKLFQDEIERQHQLEKRTPDYEYFDILKWP